MPLPQYVDTPYMYMNYLRLYAIGKQLSQKFNSFKILCFHSYISILIIN